MTDFDPTSVPDRVAEITRRFLTPDRPPLRADDHALLELASRRFNIDVEGHAVQVMVWRHSGPTALLVHGWSSRALHLAPVVHLLVKRGYQVVTFDAIAHGDSAGEWSSVRHHAATVRAVARHFPSIDLAVAHSIGSPALFLAIADGLEVKASAHIAGPASLRRVCDRVAMALSLAEDDTAAFKARVEALAALPLDLAEDARLVAAVRHPVLLVHDPEDGEVPYAESAVVHRLLAQSRLVDVPGAGHRRIIGDARTLEAIGRFIGEQGPALKESAA